jgi:hypothetical protein
MLAVRYGSSGFAEWLRRSWLYRPRQSQPKKDEAVMGDTIRNLTNAIRSGGRQLQVGPNGDVRPENEQASDSETAGQAQSQPKSTKLSPHTFGRK